MRGEFRGRDRARDKSKARLVEHKGFSSFQHDVAGIVRLRNPDGAFETLDREPLAVIDIKQFAGVEANGASDKMSCHGGLPGMSMTHVIRRWTPTSPGRAQATPETCLAYGGAFPRFANARRGLQAGRCTAPG